MRVLIAIQHRFELWAPPVWLAERLRSDFPQVEILQAHSYEEAESLYPEAEVMMTWSLRPEQFARARKLRWIYSPAAGVHALLIPEIVASDVIVTNASTVHGPVVAEHALALMLALARRFPSMARHQAQRVWAQELVWRESPRPRELRGATLGLVGVGSIGAEIARLALAFNMRIRAVRRQVERGVDFLPNGVSATADATVTGPAEIEKVLSVSDFVVLAAPVTSGTRTLLDAERLRCMKRDAYLVNVSRGALIDEPALVQALRNGELGGAALDVFEHEPLPPESPLWNLPNVLISPHAAGLTEQLWERHYALFSEDLRRFLAGQPMVDVVDKQSGY